MSFPRFPKRTFLAVAGAIAAYGIVGAFVAPPIIRNVAANKLGQRLGRVVRIDDVAINPYTLEARVEGFRILEPDGRTPFASFDALDVTGMPSRSPGCGSTRSGMAHRTTTSATSSRA